MEFAAFDVQRDLRKFASLLISSIQCEICSLIFVGAGHSLLLAMALLVYCGKRRRSKKRRSSDGNQHKEEDSRTTENKRRRSESGGKVVKVERSLRISVHGTLDLTKDENENNAPRKRNRADQTKEEKHTARAALSENVAAMPMEQWRKPMADASRMARTAEERSAVLSRTLNPLATSAEKPRTMEEPADKSFADMTKSKFADDSKTIGL